MFPLYHIWALPYFFAFLDFLIYCLSLKWILGQAILVGDWVKRTIDGGYMPCIKKMVQESGSTSKPASI